MLTIYVSVSKTVQIFRRRGDHGTLHSLHKFEAEMVGLSHQKMQWPSYPHF